MMYSYRVTEPGDMGQLQIREWDEWGRALQPTFDARLPEFNFAFTLTADEQPYALVYGYYTGPGVCDIFVTADESVAQHARWLFKHCETLLQYGFSEGVRRWQVIVPVYLSLSCEMVERLDFVVEGILAGYYPDSDAYIYGRVRPNNGI